MAASAATRKTSGLQAPQFWSLESRRFEMALLIAASMVVLGLMRNAMSMALVAVVHSNGTDLNGRDELYLLDWDADQQARIHTAFYVGALIAVFCSEYITQKFGAKHVLSLAVLLNVFGSLLTPALAILLRFYWLVAVVRLAMGFGAGFVVPCGMVIISRWFPVAEKSTAVAIFTSGNQVGIAASMLLTAKLCEIPLLGGWPLAFFLYALIGLMFVAVWHWRAADKPRNSMFITASELAYINGGNSRRRRAETVVRPTPYRKILLNGCVIAISLCSFAQSFVLVALVTYLPKYNQIAMNMDLSKNGIWSAVPFVSQMFTKLLFGILADRIKQRQVNVTLVTKTCNAIASFGTAGCILAVTLVSVDEKVLVMVLMCASMALFSAYVPGYNTSIVSVAPQFTAFISSYAQIYSQAASTLAPMAIGLITQNGTVQEWRIAFYMLVGVLVVTGVAFQFFGHGRTEPWGEIPSSAASLRLSMTINEDGPRQLSLERINSKLLLNDGGGASGDEPLPRKLKASRVSYKDEEITLPSCAQLEDLENDVIYSIEEERED